MPRNIVNEWNVHVNAIVQHFFLSWWKRLSLSSFEIRLELGSKLWFQVKKYIFSSMNLSVSSLDSNLNIFYFGIPILRIFHPHIHYEVTFFGAPQIILTNNNKALRYLWCLHWLVRNMKMFSLSCNNKSDANIIAGSVIGQHSIPLFQR
jgi:hypothetical protein